MSKPTQTNPDQLKIYNSSTYRKKIKRMVEMAKTLRGIQGKIPRGKLPARKASSTKKEAGAVEQANKLRLTIDTVHYFAHPLSSHGSAGKSYSSQDRAPQTETNELQVVP